MQDNLVITPIRPSAKKWIVISAAIGYIVMMLFLFLFVDIGNLLSVLGSINLSLYPVALLCAIVSITLHALVWFQLLNSVSLKLGFRRTYVLYWVGVFVDNLVPGGWSGDLFKAYLLSRDPKIDGGKAVASVVAKNVYEAIFNLGSMILGLALLLLTYTLTDNNILLAVGGIMVLLTLPLTILLAISFKPEKAKKFIGHFLRGLKLNRFQSGMEKLIEDYHEGMKRLLQNPRMFLKPLALSVFAWGFEVITLLMVFASLGQLIPPDKVLIVRSIAGNVEAQGYAFAGYAQIVTTALYSALGISIALSASVALLGGLVVFWIKTGISYIAFHCTIFAPCSSYVCRVVGIGGTAGNKSCKTEKKDAL